jgi:hypothetical protein
MQDDQDHLPPSLLDDYDDDDASPEPLLGNSIQNQTPPAGGSDMAFKSTMLDSKDARFYSLLPKGTPAYRATFTIVSTMAGGKLTKNPRMIVEGCC